MVPCQSPKHSSLTQHGHHGHWHTPLLGQCEVPAQDGYSFSCVPGQGGWCIQGDGKCCQGGSSDCVQRLLINMMCQAASSWCLKFYFPWITSYNCACHSYSCYFWLKRSVTTCVEWRTDYTWLCAIWRVSICMHLHMYALTCIIVVHSVFKRHMQLWWTAICTECECGNEWLSNFSHGVRLVSRKLAGRSPHKKWFLCSSSIVMPPHCQGTNAVSLTFFTSWCIYWPHPGHCLQNATTHLDVFMCQELAWLPQEHSDITSKKLYPPLAHNPSSAFW